MLSVFIISLFLLLILGYSLYSTNNKKMYKERLHQDLISKNSELFKYILDKINPEILKDELNNLVSYDLFKEDSIELLYLNLYDDINENRYNWLQQDSYDIKISDDDVSLLLREILNSKEVDVKLADMFVNRVTDNIKESEQLEQEAIIYHKSFGDEPNGSPILHPMNTNNEESELDEIREKSLEDLLSVGTVEDISE